MEQMITDADLVLLGMDREDMSPILLDAISDLSEDRPIPSAPPPDPAVLEQIPLPRLEPVQSGGRMWWVSARLL